MENQVTELSERQIKILKAIIDDYITSGNPIGSEFLEKKFKLGFSPATIRNEMVVLGKLGYIEKGHFSSGRIPTPKAFRFYINTLLPKKQLSTSEEVSIKNEVWDYQKDIFRFLEEAVQTLSNRTNLMSIVILKGGFRYYSGVDNLLSVREFFDLEFTRSVFEYIDDMNFWIKVLGNMFGENVEIRVLLGDDYVHKSLYNLGGVFSHFESNSVTGAIGILGPCRLNYSSALPLVNYTASVIREVLEKHDEKTKHTA